MGSLGDIDGGGRAWGQWTFLGISGPSCMTQMLPSLSTSKEWCDRLCFGGDYIRTSFWTLLSLELCIIPVDKISFAFLLSLHFFGHVKFTCFPIFKVAPNCVVPICLSCTLFCFFLTPTRVYVVFRFLTSCNWNSPWALQITSFLKCLLLWRSSDWKVLFLVT